MSLRKKPWNRINIPVYSISSKNANNEANMHIITYASQISMHPKQFICGLFRGTKTLENIQQHNRFVLQLLSSSQAQLVNVLGKKSGKQYSKFNYLQKKKLLAKWKDYFILKDALAVIELEAFALQPGKINEPDHEIFLCNVLDWKNLNEGKPLTLDILREKKIVRI